MEKELGKLKTHHVVADSDIAHTENVLHSHSHDTILSLLLLSLFLYQCLIYKC